MSAPDAARLMLGMAVVTFVPRALPVFLPRSFKQGGPLARLLSLMPYTALSALVFPGVFSVDAEHPLFGVASAAAASALALRGRPLVVCVLAAVGVNLVFYLAF